MKEGLLDRYRHKIVSVDELCAAVGSRPRQRRVIMCHGTFDLVHPGHVRHLIYAKSKAEILVASLTCDRHISKAAYRPYVPQELRALNLAALEMVDYVIVDDDPTPLKNLARIRPDFYAKGYEYQNGGIHPKTKEELDAISAYGGEIIFTPGDIVYSSSAILTAEPPNLAVDKLLVLMESEGVTFDRLRLALQKSEGVDVHVVGDTIVDSLTYTTMIGGMTKTPTPSLRFDRRADFIGGAAIVAAHLRAAGARVAFSTILGNDPFRDFVLDELGKLTVDCKAITDDTRPTTNKNAIVCGEYRMLKVDTLDNRSISDAIMRQLVEQVHATPVRAVAYCDFRHGIFNHLTIPALINAIPAGAFRVADSQVASRWGNILEFKNFDLITPNEREARFALADQDSGIRPLASRLHREAACGTLMLKLGDRGILTSRSASGDVRSFFVVDSFAEKVVDAVGAGDALLAYSTLAMVTDGSPVVASILGSMAAGAECERDGNVPIYPEDVLAKIDKIERQARYD